MKSCERLLAASEFSLHVRFGFLSFMNCAWGMAKRVCL